MPAHIVFASTYPPVVCGVGAYTSHLIGAMPAGRASVVAFDPDHYGAPVRPGYTPRRRAPVSYVLRRPIADPERLLDAVVDATSTSIADTVLWFQHAPDIWPRFSRLIDSIAGFAAHTVASMHTVHFQSPETPWGLRAREHAMLAQVLPRVDRVTVFTRAARDAVCRAFPGEAEKVTVITHGVRAGTPLTRADARRRLARFLVRRPEAVHPPGTARRLLGALADPDTRFVGALGFLQWGKGYDAVYQLSDALHERLPGRPVVGLVMGSLREPDDPRNRSVVAELAADADGERCFFVRTLPPDAVFRAALRAMDLNVYWPQSPTQSGRLAEALGAGAAVAGRNVEGLGETLRDVGAPACESFGELVASACDLLRDPTRAEALRARGLAYALRHSSERQAGRHLDLAEALVAAPAAGAGVRAGVALN